MKRMTKSIQFRLDVDMHRELHAKASELGVSASDMARIYIKRGLAQDTQDGGLLRGMREGKTDGCD